MANRNEGELRMRRDTTILGTIEKLFFLPHINALKNFGSPELRASYWDPIFEKQVQRGHLSPEQAKANRQAILDGAVNLFFLDLTVGCITHWGIEKALLLAIPTLMELAQQPELTNQALVYVASANVSAIPYFAVRAAQEYRYAKQQRKLETGEGIVDLKTTAIIGSSVILNAFPIGSTFVTPLATFNRYKQFSGAVLRHHWDNIKENVDRANIGIKKLSLDLASRTIF